MRKILISISLVLAVFIILAACTRSASNRTPNNKASVINPSSIATQIAQEPTSKPVIQKPVAGLQIGKIKANTSYGCAQTGISAGRSKITDFHCDLASQKASFTVNDKFTVNVNLYTTPKNLMVGGTAHVELSVESVDSGAPQQLQCSLLNFHTQQPIGQDFVVTDNLTLQATCFFLPEATLDPIYLYYTIRPIPTVCDPKVVWEQSAPTDLTLSDEGRYIAILSFPLVTDPKYQYWTSTPGWTILNINANPAEFIGAVGKILSFGQNCDEDHVLDWANRNLSDTNTMLFQNWHDAGVAK